VAGSYREPIVESEAQRLARRRRRYTGRWKLRRAVRFLLGGGLVFWLGTLVLSILTGAQAVYGVGIIVFGATVVAVWIFATVGKVDSCPRCGGQLVEPWHKQGASCATCGVSVGSLPTAEDLNDDMRIEFAPDDELDERPELVIKEPEDEE
jgi:hypothetical protein